MAKWVSKYEDKTNMKNRGKNTDGIKSESLGQYQKKSNIHVTKVPREEKKTTEQKK